MKLNAIDVSIIIVSYNTKELTQACLISLLRAKKSSSWEIIVIDNASTDGSAQMLKREFASQVVLLTTQKNIGYAAANNMGIVRSHGRYILLLNSDTEVEEGVIEYVRGFLDTHPAAGAATCRVMLPSGGLDPACHRGFPTPWAAFTYFIGLERLFPRSRLFGQYHLGYLDTKVAHEIDSPVGAFFMARGDVIAQVGLLDEAFFMYGEDLDLAYRMKSAGWKIFFLPDAAILHRKKQSGRASGDPHLRRITRNYFYSTMALFYTKHYQARYGFITTRLVLFGIWILSKFYFL